jgi:hypothetical protein
MKFTPAAYIAEMKGMVDEAMQKIARENPSFEIYTASIWTDANAAGSAINFDSKRNSDGKVSRSNEFNKEQHAYWLKQGDLKMAELFTQGSDRNCNPADFELRSFMTIQNSSIPRDWEHKTDGKCWSRLEPALLEVGEYAFQKMSSLNIHADFELGVNGKLDWYQFTWPKRNDSL